MTKDQFADRVTAMTATLYRVSYGLCRCRADQEDAVQETILRAWENLPSLKKEKYFQTWIIRILINQCHDISRRASRVVSMEDYSLPDVPAPETADLRDAVMALPEPMRLVVILHYMEGYGVDEISALLEVPAGTVKSRLHRARGALKRLLSEEADML